MIFPSGPVDVLEGGTVSFNCTSDGSVQEDILSQFNRLDIFANQNLLVVTAIPDGAAFTFGPVTVDHDGGRLRCDFILLPMESRFTDEIILNVLSELYILGTICFEINITLINILLDTLFKLLYFSVLPVVTPNSTDTTVVEEMDLEIPLTITGNPFPLSTNAAITKDGVTVQDDRITVNIGSGNGASTFRIQNVIRTDSGSYTLNVTTTVGSGLAVFNLDVQCKCTRLLHGLLVHRAVFMLNDHDQTM